MIDFQTMMLVCQDASVEFPQDIRESKLELRPLDSRPALFSGMCSNHLSLLYMVGPPSADVEKLLKPYFLTPQQA